MGSSPTARTILTPTVSSLERRARHWVPPAAPRGPGRSPRGTSPAEAPVARRGATGGHLHGRGAIRPTDPDARPQRHSTAGDQRPARRGHRGRGALRRGGGPLQDEGQSLHQGPSLLQRGLLPAGASGGNMRDGGASASRGVRVRLRPLPGHVRARLPLRGVLLRQVHVRHGLVLLLGGPLLLIAPVAPATCRFACRVPAATEKTLLPGYRPPPVRDSAVARKFRHPPAHPADATPSRRVRCRTTERRPQWTNSPS